LLHAPVAGAEVATLNEDPVRPRLIGGVEMVLRLERIARRCDGGRRERSDADGDQTEAAGHTA
jgi:hypothetical protein